MQLKLITLLGFYALQVHGAAIVKRSDSPSIDYHANKDYVPFQRLDEDLRLADEEEETSAQKKYEVTTVGSRQYRYHESTGSSDNPILVVPQVDNSHSRQALPRRKQKNLIGVDDKGHVRHVVVDSNKKDPRVGQKHILAIDDQGAQHTIDLPMTLGRT